MGDWCKALPLSLGMFTRSFFPATAATTAAAAAAVPLGAIAGTARPNSAPPGTNGAMMWKFVTACQGLDAYSPHFSLSLSLHPAESVNV